MMIFQNNARINSYILLLFRCFDPLEPSTNIIPEPFGYNSDTAHLNERQF